jgi:Mg2+ and Co2+ transporter CorA
MPVSTSAGTGQPLSGAARLADVNGLIDPAEPEDADGRFRAGGFVWLDLEDQGDRRLRAFSESLDIDDRALGVLTAASPRPSFDVAGDSIQAVVPSSNWGCDTDDILGIRVMFTGRFLLTTHDLPCRALERVQRGWDDVPDDVRSNGPSLLFFILHQIVGSFEPDLLQLDKELDQIQRALVRASRSGTENELIAMRRELSETVQALGWYLGDLYRYHGARQLPGISAVAGPRLALHGIQVAQLQNAAKGYRDQSQDALGQVGSDVSSRQGDFINILTVFSTVFLPLTFLTSYFGMNFGVITQDLNSIWSFVLLGIAFPAATVVATLSVLRRLIARMGLQSVLPKRPANKAEPHSPPGRRRDDGS